MKRNLDLVVQVQSELFGDIVTAFIQVPQRARIDLGGNRTSGIVQNMFFLNDVNH